MCYQYKTIIEILCILFFFHLVLEIVKQADRFSWNKTKQEAHIEPDDLLLIETAKARSAMVAPPCIPRLTG